MGVSPVQDNIAAGYLSAYEVPIGVSVMTKLTQWPFLQQLGFAGSLSHQSSTFHGLTDFKVQMTQYSSTNGILSAAWNLIKTLVLNNATVEALMYVDPALGKVGNQFIELANFGQAFAVSPNTLKSPGAIASQVASLT